MRRYTTLLMTEADVSEPATMASRELDIIRGRLSGPVTSSARVYKA